MPIETPALHALFVHGMGRSPLSGWPMLWHLRRAGVQTGTFGYATSIESFPAITGRLASRISRLAEQGDYVLIGHSLGGVLLRAALNALPPGTRQPRRVFLLGSPIGASRLAKLLHDHPLYRLLTRDCGQLLASEQRMQHVPALHVLTIAGQFVEAWATPQIGLDAPVFFQQLGRRDHFAEDGAGAEQLNARTSRFATLLEQVHPLDDVGFRTGISGCS